MINRFSKQSYEARIDALQRQVEEQSMTMSMYSSYTPEDFNNIEEDIFGESRTGFLYILWCSYARSIGRFTLYVTFRIYHENLFYKFPHKLTDNSYCM